MGSINRNLKAYVRYDGSGRVVPGSLVLRKNKPKVGNFQEVQGYQCCNSVTLTYTVTSPTITGVTLKLFCNGTQINSLASSANSTTIASLIIVLNNAFNVLGTFSNPSGNIIQLVVSGPQETALCPTGTSTFTVVAA